MEHLIPHTLSILRTTPRRWEDLTASLPAELLRTAPARGEWSALDCLAHLVETELQVFPVRVQARAGPPGGGRPAPQGAAC